MPEKPTAPRGRAVGDEDATDGPMDDVAPGSAAEAGGPDSAAEAGGPDTAAIEKDRAKSSGRPPLAGAAPPSGRGPASAPWRDEKAD